MRWSKSVLLAVVALFVGAGLGYMAPHSATGKENPSLLPVSFEQAMEVFTGESYTYVPRGPGFVSDGNCRLSGLAKFFPPADEDSGSVRLGYAVDLEANAAGTREMPIGFSWPYNVQFCLALLDADGFRLRTVRTDVQSLNPSESRIFQGIVTEPIPCYVADRTVSVDCRLCFEGIEIP